jgi:hypothetical protein
MQLVELILTVTVGCAIEIEQVAFQRGRPLESDIFDGNQVHLPVGCRLVPHRFRFCDVGDAILEKIAVDVVNAHGAALRAGAGNGPVAFCNCDRHILEPVIGRDQAKLGRCRIDNLNNAASNPRRSLFDKKNQQENGNENSGGHVIVEQFQRDLELDPDPAGANQS